jgi:RecG-like helicase
MTLLDQDIMFLPGMGPKRKEILNKELNIHTWGDLLEYYPYKYVDRSRIYTINELSADMPFVQIKGKILSFEEFEMGPRRKRVVAHFSDGFGVVDLVWFRGTQYIYKTYKVGVTYIVFGKPSVYGGRYQFAHPDIDDASTLQLSEMGMQPYYSTTEKMKKMGMQSRAIEKIEKTLIEKIPSPMPETLPPYITGPLHLISRDDAFRMIHYPKNADEMQHARVRLKFEELFYVQLNILRYASDHRRKYRGYIFPHVGDLFNHFYQQQHLVTIKEFLQGMDVRVELLTGIVKGKKRKEVLDGLIDGSVKILVGTHAIIEDPVQFAHLGLAVVDEQHRFGVKQRAKLWSKSENPPHVLVMTATPIPRTLAMTIYGDLDVSVIDELPPGRKPIQTIHKFDNQMTSLYNGIRQQIRQGRQVYIVFPLIQESEKSDLKNLEEGFEALRDIFPEFKMSKVHGKMKPKDKEEEMQKFVKGETQILVATTVIEVGVNVPNASVMVILDAQRFGLSQLHQLRGRVGRGADQSYCILVTNYKLAEETRKRIDIMCETNDGFQIAEADLKFRGPGDLEGTQQSGIAFDLKIADIARDGQIVQLARDEAQKIIEADPNCEKNEYMILWNRLKELRKTNINWAAIS